VPADPYGLGERQRMPCPRLLFGRSNDPNVFGESPRNGLEQIESPGIDTVVVGQKNPHDGGLWSTRAQAATAY